MSNLFLDTMTGAKKTATATTPADPYASVYNQYVPPTQEAATPTQGATPTIGPPLTFGSEPAAPSPLFDKYRTQSDELMKRSQAFEDAQAARIAPTINIGYTDPEKRAMTYAAGAPIAGAYGAAGEQLKNQAMRTGSSTALAPALKGFAQQKGRDISVAEAGVQGTMADARRTDELNNANLGLQFERDRNGNIIAAQGQQGNLNEGERGAASTEAGMAEDAAQRAATATENAKNREFQGSQAALDRAQQLEMFNKQNPGAVKGLLTGALGTAGGILGDLGTKGLENAVGLGSTAVKAATTGTDALKAAGMAMDPATGVISMSAGGGAAGGGIGPALAGFATNPITLAVAGIAGGILLGKKVFGIGNTHEKADTWVQGDQNKFDSYMDQVNKAEAAGQLQPEQAKQAKVSLVAQYIERMNEFKALGSDQRKVIQQAQDTFRKWYGDPSQYGASF